MEGEPDLALQLDIPDLDASDDALEQNASRRSENGLSPASSRRRTTYKEKSSRKSVGPENSLTADAEMMALVRARANRANRLVGSPDELDKDFAWKVDVSSLELDRIDSIMTSAGVGHLSLATAMRAVEIAKPFTRPAAQWIKGSAQDPSEVDRILLEAEQIERESSGNHWSRAQAVVIEPAVKSPTEEAQPSPPRETRLDGFWAPGQPQHCTADVADDPRLPIAYDANLARDLFQGHGEHFADRLDALAQERGDDMLIERVVNEAADAFFELLAADVELEERCADCRKPTQMMRADWLRRAARILDAQEVHYVTACDAVSGSAADEFANRAMQLFRKHGQRCRELQASDDSETIALCVVVQVAFDSDADQVSSEELHVLVAQRRQLLDQEQQWTSLQHEEAQWLAEMYHQLLDEERGLNTNSDVDKSSQASVEMHDTSTDPLLSEEELIAAACKQRASQLPTDIVGTEVTSFAALVEHVQDICKTFFDASRASLLIPRDMERRTAFFGHASAVRPRKINFAAKASHALDISSMPMKQSTSTASTPRNHESQSAPETRKKRSISQSPRRRRKRGHRRQSLSRRASILESSDILGTIMLEMERETVSPWLALDCPGDNNERASPLNPFSECDAALAWNIEKDHALVRSIAEKKSTRFRDMFREVSELCVPIFAVDPALQEDEEVFLGVLRLERALEQTRLRGKAEGKYFERSNELHARMKEPFGHMDEIVGDECAPMIANALSQYLRDAGDQEKRAATMREWEGEVENLARSCTVQAQLTDIRRGILSARSSTELCEQLAQGLYKSLWLGDLDSLRICAETMQSSDENLLGPSAQAFQRTMLDVHAPSAWDPELEMTPFEMPIAASLRALYTHRKPQLARLDLARTQQKAVKLIIIDHQDHVVKWERSSSINPGAQAPKSNRGEETTNTVTKERKTREQSNTKTRRMEIVPGLYENSGLVERINPRDPVGPSRADRLEDSDSCPWLVQYLRDFGLRVAAAVVDVASKQRLAMKCNARGATFPEEVLPVDGEEIVAWTEWASKSSSRWAFEIAFSLSQSSTAAAKKETVYFCQALALDEHQEEQDFSVWSMDDVLVRTGRGDLEILHWVNSVSPLIAETLRHLAKVEHARGRQEDHRIEMDEIRHDMAETGLRCFQEYLTSAGMHDRAALLASSDQSNNPSIPHGILVCGDLGTFCAKHDLPSQAEHPEEVMASPSQPVHANILTEGDNQGLALLDTSDLAKDLREKMWDFMQRANQDPRHAILRATSSQVSSLVLAHIAETIQPACAGLIEQTHLLLDTDNIVVYLMPEEHDANQGLKPVYAAASGKTRWEVAENSAQPEFDVEAARCVSKQGAKVSWSEDGTLASVPLYCPNDETPCFGVCQFRYSRPLEEMDVAVQIMLGCSAMVSFDLDVCLRSARDSESLARAETINRSIAEAVHSISPEDRTDWARRLDRAEVLEAAAHEIVPCEFVVPLLQVQIDGKDAFIRLDDARTLESPAACQKDFANVPLVFRSDLAVNEKLSRTLQGTTLSGHDASLLHVFLEASMNNFCIVPFAKCDGLLFLGNRVRFSPQPASLHHVSWAHRPPQTNEFSEQDTSTLAILVTIIAHY